MHVIGKGRRGRALPFGQQTAVALGRYLRARARDQWAARPGAVAVGEEPRTAEGRWDKADAAPRRGTAVGIDGLHAHMFRPLSGRRELGVRGLWLCGR